MKRRIDSTVCRGVTVHRPGTGSFFGRAPTAGWLRPEKCACPLAATDSATSRNFASGFTLVEMLVVITIIGVLVGLALPAIMRARVAAKQGVIVTEVKQLEMALQHYKEKFGEYSPDFCDVNDTTNPDLQAAAQAVVLRHLAKVFPRYPNANNWPAFVGDVSNVATGWGIDPTTFGNASNLGPQFALAFWLGGLPTVTSGEVTAFNGFSANPQNPFDQSTSRINPFFDFEPARARRDATTGGIRYWPQGAVGDRSSGAVVYFRAENSAYVTRYVDTSGNPHIALKWTIDEGDSTRPRIYPAIDYSLSDASIPRYTWANPKTMQIFSSGLDMRYSTPLEDSTFYPNPALISTAPRGPYEFPSGGNYDPTGFTYDDITNFSNGTLEDAMP